MKLAIVDNLPDGGAKRVVYEQLKFLAARHEVWYATNNLPTQLPFTALGVEKHVYDLSVTPFKGWQRFRQEWSLFYSLKRKYRRLAQDLQAWNPEIVLVHPCRYTQAPWLLTMSTGVTVYFAEEWFRLVYEPDLFPFPKTPAVKRAYEAWRRGSLRSYDLKAVKAADHIVTTSQFNALHLDQAYGVSARVIPLGVDDRKFAPRPINRSNEAFLFIGEADDVHGYPLLQAALEAAPRPFNLNVISQVNQQLALTESELVESYRQSTAVLCLDRNEPFGLIPLEAMACGVPVIAVNEGGYRETIRPEETGLLIKREPQALLAAIMRLASDPILKKKLSQNGRREVVRKYSVTQHGKQLESYLETLL